MTFRQCHIYQIYLVAALLPIALLLLALYLYDPAQIFHAPWGREQTVHTNLRLQIAGLGRHGEFDSVILGTSMLENSSAAEMGEALNGNFVNLSISAGDFYERRVILDYLLRKKTLKQVVWSMDFIYLNQRRGYWVIPLSTFEFLYDKNPLNDLRLYFNMHYLGCLFQWSDEEECAGRRVTLDRPNAWYGDIDHSARFGGIDKWCAAIDHWQMKDVYKKVKEALAKQKNGEMDYSLGGANVQRAISYVEDNLMSLAIKYPETTFRLVFPPYSRAKYAIWYQQQPGSAETHMTVIRHVVGRADVLQNVEVYGFEDMSFPDQIDHYKDLDHYDTSINELIAKAMKDRRNRLTSNVIDRYLKDSAKRALQYDLAGLKEQLDQCLHKSAD